MMPPTIKNPAHEKGVPTRKLTITPPTSSSKPNPMHNQVASRRRDVGLGVDPAPVEAVTGNHPARDGHGLVSSSLFFQRRAPMAAGAFYSIRMNRSPWPGFKLPAVAPFKQVVQDADQIMRGRAGAGQISGSAADGPAGIGVVVGPDPAGVVVDVQPTIKLAKQLRQPADQQGTPGCGDADNTRRSPRRFPRSGRRTDSSCRAARSREFASLSGRSQSAAAVEFDREPGPASSRLM